MKQANRCRLWLETLEDRTVPTVSATVLPGGLLYVADSAPASVGPIRIVQTANNTFNVLDGATQINGAPLVATNIRVALTAANDDLRIDLNGKTFNGSVLAFLGAGVNTATVYGNETNSNGTQGSINGFLQIYGGIDIDTVNLNGTNPGGLKVGLSTFVNLGGSAFDVLNTTGAVNLNGGLSAYYANSVTINSGTTVGNNVFLYGGNGGNNVNFNVGASVAKNFTFAANFFNSFGANTVNVNGAVGQDLVFTSSIYNSIGHSLTLGATGTVARDLLFYGSNQADDLTVNGSVARNLVAYTGAGDDTVTLNGSVGAAVYLFLGAGNDTATLNGSIGAGPATTQVLFIDAGAGDDTVNFNAGANINGKSTVLLGAGNDTFNNNGGAHSGAFLVDGGAGTDTFMGLTAGFTTTNFENFV